MRHLKPFSESIISDEKFEIDRNNFSILLKSCLVEIEDKFEVEIYFNSHLKDPYSEMVHIFFSDHDSKGQYTLDGGTYMNDNYPIIDNEIEASIKRTELLKILKRVMIKLLADGYTSKIDASDRKETRLMIYKPPSRR